MAVGFVLFSMSHIFIHKRGEVPEGKDYSDTAILVDSGIYAIVRHPIFLGYILIILALILIAQHWLSAIIGVPMMVSMYLGMREEEQSNIEKLGDAYKRYMQSTPRMNLLVGVIRLLRHRKRERK